MNEMWTKKTVKNDQSGQALVEYILILAISVALILGLMNQVYKPFGSWLQNYMGAYLECLIDIGELPSLGYEGGSGECNNRFQAGTVTGGRPPKKSTNSSSSAEDRGRSGSKDKNGDGSGGSVAGSGGRRSSAASQGFSGGRSGADGPVSGENSGPMTEALSGSSYFRLKSAKAYSVSSSVRSDDRAQGLSGMLSTEQKKVKNREQKAFAAARIGTDEDTQNQRGKKLLVKPGERKVAAEEEAPSWGFSQYMKYFLILIILIAIILFLGGQVLQISKGMEK